MEKNYDFHYLKKISEKQYVARYVNSCGLRYIMVISINCMYLFFLFQSLVEKHFPAPDRDKINRILGIGKQKTILDELGKKTPELFIIYLFL